MRYVGTTTGRLPVDTGQVRLRGPRVSASSARHLVADARGGDVPAHPRLALIAECGRLAGDGRARSRDMHALPVSGAVSIPDTEQAVLWHRRKDVRSEEHTSE